ncbi:MAG: DUF427 domain-containing protein [Pseudomonadota bacterium]
MTTLPLENVQDYPRPPLIEPVPQVLRVLLGGQIAAETLRGWRICETHHAPAYYIPRDDVTADLSPVAGQSFCEWKGVAAYWDVTAGGRTAARAAWSYAEPNPVYAAIQDHLAFYVHAMDACFVGDERVTPQPGDFYGGWVTANLTGQIKGAPGTRHW